jgi:hypothetical protein
MRRAYACAMITLRSTLFTTWLVAVTAALAFVAIRNPAVARGAPGAPRKMTLDELDVQRINVREPDGKPRVITTSRARLPGAIFGGVEYPHPGRDVGGGLLFFNDEGTEAGGLCYSNRKVGNAADNQMVFTADQYNQNELMGLSYGNERGKRTAGLTVYDDRPEKSLLPVVQAFSEMTRATAESDKQERKQRVDLLIKDSIDRERTRVFVGKRGEDAEVVLGDRQGKPRIVLRVNGKGEPAIELLDAAGAVIKRISP